MQSKSTAQLAPIATTPPATTQTTRTTQTRQRLDSARARVGVVNEMIAATEGRLLDFETADSLCRTLSAVVRDLEEVTLAVAVLQRKEARANG